MTVTLRLGRWQDVLTDVAMVDTLVVDPPYSATTHEGALSATGEGGVLGYAAWTDDDARAFVASWAPRTRNWIVIHTDDVLGPVLRAAMLFAGRYTFPLVPVLQHQPRQIQDGPPQHGHYLAVSRPRDERFTVFGGDAWGSLPGWYEVPRAHDGVKGGKPLVLMRAIVRDYSRPGDLVCDPCAGGGTTLVAADELERNGIGSEMDADTFALAEQRLAKARARDLFAHVARQKKPEQAGLL